MGDRLRKQGRRLLAAAFDAALPAMLMYMTMLLSLILRGTAFAEGVPLRFFLAALIVCYATAYAISLMFGRHHPTAARVDEYLIGNAFGSFSKRDRFFCRGLELFSAGRVRIALEYFQKIRQEYPLTDHEKGVCSFYIGRCYLLLECPSNAVQYLKEAAELGFAPVESRIFLARAYCNTGDFDEGKAVYDKLLEMKIPNSTVYVYTDIGFLYLLQYQPETALKWFQKALAEKEGYASALSGLAIVLLQQGKFRKARAMATLAVTNRVPNPSDFREWFTEVEHSLLAEHPDWDPQEGLVVPEQKEPVQQGGATDGSI